MCLIPLLVKSTSIKMDFLSSGTVRTDPLTFSEIGECLSDHVHRYYGSVSDRTMRPEVSYEDMRNATGNTGNVEENKSLYWDPAIYKVVNQDSDNKTFELVDVWFASAYYVWRTGYAKSFPNGLKMRAKNDNEKLTRARAVCSGPSACEREDKGSCSAYGPSSQAEHGFLPVDACWELEINIKFPTCWDGVNLEAKDGVKHVVYADECDGKEHNECFDFDCPASHPVRMPELPLYVRVLDYEGGAHVFADGSDVFHSDYFSGWDEDKLQHVLDNCGNDSEAAMPNAFCSDFLTFRGKGKVEGVQVDDFDIREDLEKIQPGPIDIMGTISPEDVTGVPELPRGVCTGELIAASNATATTSAPAAVSGVTTCAAKGRTKKVVLVKEGESYRFETNEASKYGPNVKCLVTYKRRGSCKKMRVSCDQFSLATGDTLRVQRGRNKQTFRGSSGPTLETT